MNEKLTEIRQKVLVLVEVDIYHDGGGETLQMALKQIRGGIINGGFSGGRSGEFYNVLLTNNVLATVLVDNAEKA